ncbi:hypothetical protein FACS189494_04310 [Spirochaetia bacterium]|nr:hypothetical protein FACS189494_04310 [Spirochaetia bacterium]
MKYCHRPFDFLYLDNSEGDVYLCPWMEPSLGPIGNILENDVETVWKGEKAENLRNLFRENYFMHCRPQGCPHVQNHDLPEISDEEEFQRLTVTQDRPKTINLAYDSVCNQSCETCRKKVFIPPPDYKEKVNIIRERISPYINTAEELTASGHGDPFASPYMMDLLAGLNPSNPKMRVLLETNGVFFDEKHWERIEHLGKYNISVVLTSNSFNEYTYNLISRGGMYKKLIQNLKFIKTLRESGAINRFVSSFVIQDRNFREIPEFIERSLNEFGFDDVVLKPVYQWGTMDEKVFWFKDVLNPAHPYHQEYLTILKHPLMHDKRVYNFGGESVHPCRDFEIVEEQPCQPEPEVLPILLPPLEVPEMGRKQKLKKGIKLCASAVLGKNLCAKLKKFLHRG